MAEYQSLRAALYEQAKNAINQPLNLKSALIVVILLFISSSSLWSYSKKQRLAPAVPIVGVDANGNVKAARKRFTYDAKGMLQEGYGMVSGLSRTYLCRSDGHDRPKEACSTSQARLESA